MHKFNYERVESAIGYQFKNRKLLKQAFFRSSFAHENGRESNEVLEFIGDKVLDLAVIRILLEKYAKTKNSEGYFKSKKQEGEFTKIKSELVSTGYLAGSFDALLVEEDIYYGKSDLNNKVTDVISVKEDIFEAIIGAIALDANWNMDIVVMIVKKLLHIDKYLEQREVESNSVGLLQETTAKLGFGTPSYHLTSRKQENGLVWIATLVVDGVDYVARGVGNNQKSAKKAAAEKMLDIIEIEYLPKINEENNKDVDVFGLLNSAVQLRLIKKPDFHFNETYDENGNPIWECVAIFSDVNKVFVGKGSTKKEAQKKTLMQSLDYLR